MKAKGKFTALDLDKEDSKEIDYASVIVNAHSPSLHSIDGQKFDLELDVVHNLVSGEESANTLAVVSLLFKSTTEPTPFFDQFSPKTEGKFSMNLAQVLDGNLDVYYYQNKFVTPRNE